MSVDPDTLAIVRYPDPILKRKAEPVDPADETVRAVARRMVALMHEAEGIGLAGPQVGLPWRLFVTNVPDVDPEDRVYLNPELVVGRTELVSAEEGCLSLPGITVQVRRPETAAIAAVGLEGERVERSVEGFLARVWQHEFDHLDGVLITDRMTPMDRLANRKALKALASD